LLDGGLTNLNGVLLHKNAFWMGVAVENRRRCWKDGKKSASPLRASKRREPGTVSEGTH